MSIKTKKKFKNIGKVVAGVLFALLLFTNIKVALMDDAEILSGDISLLGVELTLFDATYACTNGTRYEGTGLWRDFGDLGWAQWYNCFEWHDYYQCNSGAWGF